MNTTRLFSDRISSNRTGRLLRKLAQAAASLLLAAGLVGGAATASAQATSASAEANPAQWQANFDRQVAHELRQSPSVRASLLQVVTDQASRSEDLKLPRTTEALLHVVENDANQRNRLMAVQALYAIGSEHVGEKRHEEAMSRLYTLAEEEPSEKVRDAVADAIDRSQTG